MIELEQAMQAAKMRWAKLEMKMAAQQRLLDAATEKTQAHEAALRERDEEIARLDGLTKVLTVQRDAAVYESKKVSQALRRSEGEVRTMTDDIISLDHKVQNLRNKLGLVEHAA